MLKDARKLLDKTLEDIAAETGLSKPTIINVERGFGLAKSAEAVRSALIKFYDRIKPLTPEERDVAFRALMRLSTQPENHGPEGGKRGRGRPAKKAGEGFSPVEEKTSPVPAQAVALLTEGAIHGSSDNAVSAGNVQIGTGTTAADLGTPNCDDRCGRTAIARQPRARSSQESYSVPMRFFSVEDADRAWRLASTSEETAAFYLAVRQSFAAYHSLTDRSIRRIFAQRTGTKKRDRKCDPKTEEKKTRIIAAVAPALEWFRKNSTHAKGAYDTRSFGFRRSALEEILKLDRVNDAIVDPDTGEIPSRAYVEKVLAEKGFTVDARNEPDDFIQKTIGTRPRFAGDVILADFTGMPFCVEGHVLEVVNKKTGKKERKYKRFGMHLAVDAASNFTFANSITWGDNEQATWPTFLEWLLFESLGYVPGFLVMDQVSGVITSLLKSEPDDRRITAMPEVLAFVAAGTCLHVHTPERANAKGGVESAAKLMKHRELNAMTVRKCLEHHMRGVMAKPRHLTAHSEVPRMIAEMTQNANKRLLNRDGLTLGPRHEIWSEPEEIARRNETALAPEARSTWREIVSKSKVVWCSGKTAYLKIDGVRYLAELGGLEEAAQHGLTKIQDAKAWIVPPLPSAKADPEEYRVCLIQQPDKGGLPRFHKLTARPSKKDKYGFDDMRPFFGLGYHAQGETRADEIKKNRDQIAKAWPAIVAGLREGTTGEPVGDGVVRVSE